MKTFTFNGPLASLVYLLLAAFTTVLIISFWNESNFFVLILILVNLFMVLPMFAASYLRRLKISPEKAQLRTLRKKWEFPLSELKHFGIRRYRSFRFIYLSISAEKPFADPEAPVVSSPETFVIQFREKPWQWIRKCVAQNKPELEPEVEK